ncbi:lipopolysaccharide heptosyltransferase II [Pseudohongiella sp.]|uniref:lipopolysaccharide heptosyltransferase II n=1 Tax=marine sediment metagenome TaxID=412755 RepID=A0A0F9VVK7_9ZZZZ|nr:lipopolysaccharide heptosyltransferase II [Pseudohongiella sp.]HDZ07935.1 lipopolysaccharide heptosyltransferase II [Pseudohongiella sp.]HEA64458.1 lipopolysaccharide heptosyltransferase II [Pseudohongiella sp.]
MTSKSSAPRRILVVGPSWVGDMVMAQSLFMALKAQNPAVIIDVLASSWSRPLLARMPQVSQAIDLPFAHGELGLRRRYALGRELRNKHYDQTILLPNSFKSALVPWFARIPMRTGWRGEMRSWILNDSRVLAPTQLPLMVQRFLALALPASAELPAALPDPIPVPQLQSDPDQVLAAMRAFELARSPSVLALCPGAEFGDAKQWPAAHYAAVASAHLDAGGQVWLFGSAKDREVTEDIVAQVAGPLRHGCHNLAGRTSLAQAIDLLSVADAVVSNDSGLMHIAAALHRPVVAVYGSTSPEFTPPLTDRVELLSTDIECRPCFQRTCPLGHKRCLTELSPARVIGALQRLSHPLIATRTS